MDKREILCIHVGQAGLQLGATCWELFCLEHGICPNGQQAQIRTTGRQNPYTFFENTGAGKFIPRALFIDLEPSVINDIQYVGFNRDLFRKNDMMVIGKEDAACNFARGRYSVGADAIDIVKCRLRKILENYENCQGFILFNGFSGGTGSGFATLIMDFLRDAYPKKTRFEVGVYPSKHISNIIVEPYNAVLATHTSIDEIDCCVMLDNESVYGMCRRKLNIPNPKYANINRLIAQAVSSITASLRFGGLINVGLDELQTNLVPFPRLHFPIVSYSPIITWEKVAYDTFSGSDLMYECFERKSQFIKTDPPAGKYMSCCLLFRGDVLLQDITRTVSRLKRYRSIKFASWCPCSFKIGFNLNPPMTVEGGDLARITRACCMVANSTSVAPIWLNLSKQFNMLFSKRAFLHWYLTEGMEMDEFRDARENMACLEKDYEEAADDSIDMNCYCD